MRYDTPIYFQKITPGEYDPDTGNYTPDSVKETLRYAAVIDTAEYKAGKSYNTAADPFHRAV